MGVEVLKYVIDGLILKILPKIWEKSLTAILWIALILMAITAQKTVDGLHLLSKGLISEQIA